VGKIITETKKRREGRRGEGRGGGEGRSG